MMWMICCTGEFYAGRLRVSGCESESKDARRFPRNSQPATRNRREGDDGNVDSAARAAALRRRDPSRHIRRSRRAPCHQLTLVVAEVVDDRGVGGEKMRGEGAAV